MALAITRWWRAAALAAAAVIVIATAPPAAAVPVSPLCDDLSWRRQHPLICDTGGPLPNLGGGGGGTGGGLIGRIIDAIGGLPGPL